MVQLDLIELADLVRPEQLVDEIVRQNPDMPIPVPIEEIARLAGITKVEAFQSEGFEGALVSDMNKSQGAIFYSSLSPRPRQRFTIGHELGHFLLPWHRQSSFECTSADISGRGNKEWELQANQFSAELLMPHKLVKSRLHVFKDPEMAHIIQLRDEFGTSMEMTARRLIELNEYPCAVVFSKDNMVRYSVRSDYFSERLCLKKGDRLPMKSVSRQSSVDHTEWYEIDAHWWLSDSAKQPESVYEQTFVQEEGHKVTLVTYEDD